MEARSVTNNVNPAVVLPEILFQHTTSDINETTKEELRNFFRHIRFPWLEEALNKLTSTAGKKSFLVFKNNKYVNVLTDKIAFFYIKYESAMIMTFNREEYFVNYSLEQVQNLLPEEQFFRLNRQYLINFNAVKEVEHYFARKLLVNPVIPMKDKLIVSKERVTEFLQWLDNR
ncbi:LytR/AlgR family response regulator transcription factor [Parafilimonas terrae]|uniref:LytTr DNA-binding domain-containing protein n=1 Tax=Parafilimonas terrae TaxID=1465490 RepID=A0A1I5Y1G4_9BACT|nr:LytTR family DNA-binding domain-containing protein [Parafilimonas terrae]SFQ38081.1 LytTr DNA-binding domain-containing protein [Parafilimonas terrae]